MTPTRLPSIVTALALIMALSPHARAQEEEANRLSDEEIAGGWIQLFDGETTFGWTVEADDPGRAVTVSDGAMTITGPAMVKTTTEFGLLDLRFAVRLEGPGAARLRRPSGQPSPDEVLEGSEDAEFLLLRPSGQPSQRVALDWVVEPPPDRWTLYTLSVTEGGIEGNWQAMTQSAVAESFSGDHMIDGPVRESIAFRVGDGTTLTLRGIALRTLGTEPLFNGKDLSGWNVLEGGESVYSVTDEGHLNVKNGRGDIQTEGQYDDFVLQLDVFSNGEHLNSGIFLRALPGEFWSGYESQIRNEFEGDDRTKPVDFGTGAIYRRQAARKVVADDFAWFTKTIVVHDNHFAVWVNGHHVTDWTDDREPADNGRNGDKRSPGVISIQGHDPTTDLSFRNLRIHELPRD